MGLVSEFREFAMKGNVVDLAVGVVIGGAFGKIVTSLVEDVIMPLVGRLVGGINFTDLAVSLGAGPDGQEVLLRYGSFAQNIVNFLIVAWAIFLVIKAMNRLKRAEAAPPPAAPAPTKSELLLEEIRDLLRK